MKGSSNTIISDSLVADVRAIIEDGRQRAYAAAGRIALQTYWNIGRRIVEEEQQGNSRADYGKRLIPALADILTIKYGSGYSKRNLAYYRKFYLEFKNTEILHTLVQNLNWSHIRRLLSVSDPQAREWYLKTASTDMWSVKTLDRNISSQYYERRLAAQRSNTAIPAQPNASDPMEYIKNPMVAEFMGFKRDNNYSGHIKTLDNSTCMSGCTTTWLRAPMMPQLLELCFALIPTRQLPDIRCCMTTNSCMQQNI